MAAALLGARRAKETTSEEPSYPNNTAVPYSEFRRDTRPQHNYRISRGREGHLIIGREFRILKVRKSVGDKQASAADQCFSLPGVKKKRKKKSEREKIEKTARNFFLRLTTLRSDYSPTKKEGKPTKRSFVRSLATRGGIYLHEVSADVTIARAERSARRPTDRPTTFPCPLARTRSLSVRAINSLANSNGKSSGNAFAVTETAVTFLARSLSLFPAVS